MYSCFHKLLYLIRIYHNSFFVKFMPVILGGDLRLPDDSKLRVYRKENVPLPKNELITLATIDKNGKQLLSFRESDGKIDRNLKILLCS